MRLRGGGDDGKPDVPSTKDDKEARKWIGDKEESSIEKSETDYEDDKKMSKTTEN